MPWIPGKDGKAVYVEDNALDVHNELDPVKKTELHPEDIDFALNKIPSIPGGASQDEMKATMLNPNNPEFASRLKRDMDERKYLKNELINSGRELFKRLPVETEEIQNILADTAFGGGVAGGGASRTTQGLAIGGGLSILNKLSRVFTFPNALEVGITRGIIKEIDTQEDFTKTLIGTLIEGPTGLTSQLKQDFKEQVTETVQRRETWPDFLAKDLGLPKGPIVNKFVDFSATLKELNKPSTFFWLGLMKGIKDTAISGGIGVKDFADIMKYKTYGPEVSARGLLGFGLDVATDPVTYLSFGASGSVEKSVKELVEAENDIMRGVYKVTEAEINSVKNILSPKELGIYNKFRAEGLPYVRFADQNILTSKGLEEILKPIKSAGEKATELFDRGAKYLSSFKEGQAILKQLDIYMAFGRGVLRGAKDIGEAIGKVPLELFSTSFNKNPEVVSGALRIQAAKAKEIKNIAEGFQQLRKTYKDIDIEKVADRLFNVSKEEAGKREIIKARFVGKMKELQSRITQLHAERTLGQIEGSKFATRLGKLIEESGALRQSYRNELKAIPRVVMDNPHEQKLVDFLIDNTMKLGKKAGYPEELFFSTYLPGIRDEILNKSNLIRTRPRFFPIASKGFKKKTFAEGLSKDILGAFEYRMKELSNYAHDKEFYLQTIGKFGKKNLREGLEKGYAEFYTRDRLRFFKKQVGEGQTITAVTKEAPIYLPERVANTLTDLEKAGVINATGENLRRFIKLTDNMLGTWKLTQTAIWPAFHFRNFVSNWVLRYLNEGSGVFKIGSAFDAAQALARPEGKEIMKLGGVVGDIAEGDLHKLLVSRRIAGTSAFNEFELFNDVLSLPSKEVKNKIWGGVEATSRTTKKLFEYPKQFGAMIEDHAKASSWIQAIKDGHSLEMADRIAWSGLFDYANLTRYERDFFKRLFPFYTFTRKNLSLQMGTLLHNPGRQGNIVKLFEDLSKDTLSQLDNDQLEAFNQSKSFFLENAFTIPAGINPKTKEVFFMTGFGMPQENAMDFFGNFKGSNYFQLNPAIKYTLEKTLQQDIAKSFTFGKPVALKESYKFDEMNTLVNMMGKRKMSPEELKDWMNDPEGMQKNPLIKLMGIKAKVVSKYEGEQRVGEEVQFVADPNKLLLMRQLLIPRIASTMRQIGNDDIESQQKFSKFLTGWEVVKSTASTNQFFAGRQLKEDLAFEQKKMGLGGTLEIPYAKGEAKRSGGKRFNKRIGKLP